MNKLTPAQWFISNDPITVRAIGATSTIDLIAGGIVLGPEGGSGVAFDASGIDMRSCSIDNASGITTAGLTSSSPSAVNGVLFGNVDVDFTGKNAIGISIMQSVGVSTGGITANAASYINGVVFGASVTMGGLNVSGIAGLSSTTLYTGGLTSSSVHTGGLTTTANSNIYGIIFGTSSVDFGGKGITNTSINSTAITTSTLSVTTGMDYQGQDLQQFVQDNAVAKTTIIDLTVYPDGQSATASYTDSRISGVVVGVTHEGLGTYNVGVTVTTTGATLSTGMFTATLGVNLGPTASPHAKTNVIMLGPQAMTAGSYQTYVYHSNLAGEATEADAAHVYYVRLVVQWE